MHNDLRWIWLASSLLLACVNAAPSADFAQTTGGPAALGDHSLRCELADSGEADVETPAEHSRGLFVEQARASDSALTYTEREATCSGRLPGSYALRVELDVYARDQSALPAEHDPSRGPLTLLLRADVSAAAPSSAPEARLRVCGLDLPPAYTYATSTVTELRVPEQVWDRAPMPVFPSHVSVVHAPGGPNIEIEAFPVLLGVALTDPGADWPSYEQTPTFACGAGRSGSDCFPDHDGDGEPGLSLNVRLDGEVTDAPYPGCAEWHYAGPSTDAEPWLAAPGPGPTRLFVGLRTALKLFLSFDETCGDASGSADAEDVVTRTLDCELSDGQPCSPNQATVVDARAASFHVLGEGEAPPASFRDSRPTVDEALDRTPSAGGRVSGRRLDADATDDCEPVRAAFAP